MNINFSFDEKNVQVGFENQFVVKDFTNKTLVKLLMLKGEKGDTVSAEWGNITGNITNQTDLSNALNNKADTTDIPTDLNQLSNTTTKFVNETQLQAAISSLGSIFTLKGSVATVNDLPSQNNNIGDVYYVVSESAGYIWIDDDGTLRWEQLGMTVDTTDFLKKSGLLSSTGNSTTNTMHQSAITAALNNKADTTDIPTKTSDLTNDSNYITPSYHDATKQDVLVSGTNIKTINNQDILGSGNIKVESSAVWGSITGELHNQQDLHNELQAKADLTDLPTKTSDLTNDSGYITNEYHDATKQDVINNLGVINNNLKFSLDELVVGEYLNKPLYRKVIEATVNANASITTKLSDLGITGQDIVLINLGKSIAKYGTAPNFGWSPVSYYITNSDSSVVYINTVGNLVIKNNTAGSRDYKVVLEYTKIADSG